MKTMKQTHESLSHLADRLQDHRVAMLTVMEDGVGLTSRPMTPLLMDRDGSLWFMGSHQALDRVLGNGLTPVNLAFARHTDSQYASVSGEAELIDDAARKEDLWTIAARPFFSGSTDPDLVLVKVRPAQAEVWDGPDNAATRVLAMAASVIAGRGVGMGKKETIEVDSRPLRI